KSRSQNLTELFGQNTKFLPVFLIRNRQAKQLRESLFRCPPVAIFEAMAPLCLQKLPLSASLKASPFLARKRFPSFYEKCLVLLMEAK
ncbi:MAG TPA: hypothetical protein PKD78_02790, partial [Saprospiraceae bacterium]|nr:hypothetical protein [Saprospiraceae bacterium]HNG90383.1 hypothetical protein [Saprospiraceae bacterium]